MGIYNGPAIARSNDGRGVRQVTASLWHSGTADGREWGGTIGPPPAEPLGTGNWMPVFDETFTLRLENGREGRARVTRETHDIVTIEGVGPAPFR